MLKNVNPLLTAELLSVLAAMGHGDELAVTDANFPADSVARGTCHGRVVCLAGVSVPQAVSAILSVLPLDEFVDAPVRRMASNLTAGEFPRYSKRSRQSSTRPPDGHWPMGDLERFAFYEAARNSYAVVFHRERRLFGNVLIKKGALPRRASQEESEAARGGYATVPRSPVFCPS